MASAGRKSKQRPNVQAALDKVESQPDRVRDVVGFLLKGSQKAATELSEDLPVSSTAKPLLEAGAKSAPVQPTPVQGLHQGRIDTSAKSAPVQSEHQYIEPESHYLKVPNDVIDRLMPLLGSSEFKVYLRLFRLSHGFRQVECLVGYGALSSACGLSLPRGQKRHPTPCPDGAS
jgi:hypothetical protein